ncbi:MAG: tetratricopeptide repeat protein, partial [Halobacteriovoraceae bacterium]|nr:tetratricopeptide repeat protein [Halobacteriovoraceae bacterium]
MRYFIVCTIFISFIMGCASNQKIGRSDNKNQKKFVDGFRKKLGEYDVLARESAVRFSDSRLDELLDDGHALSQVTASCIQEDFSKGFDILDENYLKYKKHPAYWNQMGSCYFHKGELDKAVLYYNKSREINPRYAPPLNNLGVIYQNKGLDQKALVAFKKTLKLDSKALTPSFNLAQLYLKYGMIKRALAIYSKLYKANDADNDVINGMANCYLMQGKINNALRFFAKIDYDVIKRPT